MRCPLPRQESHRSTHYLLAWQPLMQEIPWWHGSSCCPQWFAPTQGAHERVPPPPPICIYLSVIREVAHDRLPFHASVIDHLLQVVCIVVVGLSDSDANMQFQSDPGPSPRRNFECFFCFPRRYGRPAYAPLAWAAPVKLTGPNAHCPLLEPAHTRTADRAIGVGPIPGFYFLVLVLYSYKD